MKDELGGCGIFVLGTELDSAMKERLGDARRLADSMGTLVGAFLLGADVDPDRVGEAGADHVVMGQGEDAGPATRMVAAQELFSSLSPRLVICPGDPDGREWAARLALAFGWAHVSPVLMAKADSSEIRLTSLSSCGRFSHESMFQPGESAVITIRSGVAEALRQPHPGEVILHDLDVGRASESVEKRSIIWADPESVAIEFADRVVSGGRGLGDQASFRKLESLARQLKASVAASRVAVDQGWAPPERQVGQSGKTVQPKLYIALGISGASHHLAGMRDADHIIAINHDPDAPIFEVAHLGLVTDVHTFMAELEKRLVHPNRKTGVPDAS